MKKGRKFVFVHKTIHLAEIDSLDKLEDVVQLFRQVAGTERRAHLQLMVRSNRLVTKVICIEHLQDYGNEYITLT